MFEIVIAACNPAVPVSVEVGSVTMAIGFSLSHKQKWTDSSIDVERERGMRGSQRSTLKQRATQMDLGPQG